VSGVVVRFDQAVLEWSRAEGKVNLIVLGTKVFDVNGHIIAQAPKADLDFDAAAIVAGHLNVRRLGLIGVQITGVRAKDGTIRLGFGPEQDNADLLKTLRDILKDSAAGGVRSTVSRSRMRELLSAMSQTASSLFRPRRTSRCVTRTPRWTLRWMRRWKISGASSRITANAVLRSDGSPDHGTIAIKGLSLPALAKSSDNFAALKPYRLVSRSVGGFRTRWGGQAANVDFPRDRPRQH
jgi:hypothetical protein